MVIGGPTAFVTSACWNLFSQISTEEQIWRIFNRLTVGLGKETSHTLILLFLVRGEWCFIFIFAGNAVHSAVV